MQKQYDKNRKRTKVTIFDSDLERWGIKDLTEEEFKQIVKAGLKNGPNSKNQSKTNESSNETVIKKLDDIEERLNRFIRLTTHYVHHIYVSNHKEILKFRRNIRNWTYHGEVGEDYGPQCKMMNDSEMLRAELFPELNLSVAMPTEEDIYQEKHYTNFVKDKYQPKSKQEYLDA